MNGTILYTTDSNAPYGFRRATLEEIMTGARQALALRVRKGTELTSPQRTRDYLMTRLAKREFETFTLIYLDNRHRLITCQDLFRGTIDGASVHPREVVKEALKHNAAAKSSARWRRRIQAHTFGSGRQCVWTRQGSLSQLFCLFPSAEPTIQECNAY